MGNMSSLSPEFRRKMFRPGGYTAPGAPSMPPPPPRHPYEDRFRNTTRSASNPQRMAGESVAPRRQDSQALSFEDQEIRRMDRERAVQERRDRERAARREQEAAGNEQYLYFD